MRIDDALREIISNEYTKANYSSISHFCRVTQIKMSPETVRRVLYDTQYKGTEVATLAIVMRKLGMQPPTIRELIRKHTDDEDLWPLLGDREIKLSQEEESLVDAYRKIVEANKTFRRTLADQVDLVALAAGVDTSAVTSPLRK